MSTLKKTLALLLTLFMTAAVCGCGAGGNAGQAGGTTNTTASVATYLYNSEPLLDWDPSVEFSNGIVTLNNIYETLLYYDAINDKLEPRLAMEYSHSEDGLVWTFKIREGVKFHDGTALNAEAVKFSIDRTIEKGMGAAYIWDSVSEIKAVDEYTVEFDLSYAAPIDLVCASGYAAFIFSPAAVKGYGDAWPEGSECGTGPYLLQSYTAGEEVILTKFDDYWRGWDGKHFDKAVIKKVSETASRRQMMEKGDGDVTFNLPAQDVAEMKSNSLLNIVDVPSFQNLLVMLNCEKAPLDNPLVRQAMAYAFPYGDVVQYAAGAFATQSTGAIPAGHWGHGKDLFQYTYDLDKARELFDEAGVDPSSIKLLLTYMSGDESEKKTAELYKSELAKLGIDLEIRSMSWESQWELAKGNEANRQDIFIMYWWPDYATPYTWMFNLFHSEDTPAYNLNYYYNDALDTMIDEANVLAGTDRNAAEQKFIEAQKMLLEDCPSIFAYDLRNVWVENNTFMGHNSNPIYPNVIFFYDCYRG